MRYNIAFVGNPNCGKTTLFNKIAGTRRQVGNYSGVTVEAFDAHFHENGFSARLIDLPGVYGLSGNSPEESVVLKTLLHERIDLIVNIVDASNLERHLFLTTQLLELNRPMLLVLNMVDEAKKSNIKINSSRLSSLLHMPCVEMIASTGFGMETFKSMLMSTAKDKQISGPLLYDVEMEQLIKKVCGQIFKIDENLSDVQSRFIAIKTLEETPSAVKYLTEHSLESVNDFAMQILHVQAKHEGINASILMAHKRYAIIAGVLREVVEQIQQVESRTSAMIDKITTHRILGLPIFLALMFGVFYLVFGLGEPMMSAIESGVDICAQFVAAQFEPYPNLHVWKSLIVDGIFGGVGGVLVFLPNIVLLYLAISILEGTGYMARAAFIMDQIMHKFGLHGKSFIPMLIGFGCTVPAILATRTIESRRDRLVTILILPLMSCGARLPIYALIVPIFFAPMWQGAIVWLIYIVGILLAVICARILKSTFFKGGDEVFIMELPPYRIPTLRSILIHMFERSWEYVKKAGTVILLASILMWYMNHYPEVEGTPNQVVTAQTKAENSYSGKIGGALSVVLEPIGFDWKISSALVGAFAAKELFVSQLSILYATEESDNDESFSLRAAFKEHYTALQGFCVMLFCLISIPCIATVVVTAKESHSWMFAAGQLVGLTVLAWVLTFIVFQVGSLFN